MYGSHSVKCTTTADQCPEDWWHLGSRYNNEEIIDEQCTDGDAAKGGSYGGNITTMCGKRCTCHFHYRSREDTLDSYSTQHGLCFNTATDEFYCAYSAAACDSDETYYGSLSPQLESYDCTCEK